jgi:hypothetical protein
MTREEIIAAMKQQVDQISEAYRPALYAAFHSGDKEREAEIRNQIVRDITLARAPYARMWAMLPPEPVVIAKDKQP